MELKEVFEPILKFMKNFQKKDKDISKQAAKDRLKLVLMQDRASVSPDFFEMMKKEIIDVIKKYIEIDEESLEVQLTRGFEAGLEGPALYANIPIKNIKPVASDGSDEESVLEVGENISEIIANEVTSQVAKISEEDSNIKTAVAITSNDENIENVATVQEVVTSSESVSENISPDTIAENVANEMKKSAKATTTKAKTSSKSGTTTKKTTTKKTTSKTSTTKKTATKKATKE